MIEGCVYMVISFIRGQQVEYDAKINKWVYSDTKEPVTFDRQCKKCSKMPTSEGYDACLRHLPGVKNACCGHDDNTSF